jgi:hypothetical protein
MILSLVWHGMNHDSPPPPQHTHGNGILQLQQGPLGKEVRDYIPLFLTVGDITAI